MATEEPPASQTKPECGARLDMRDKIICLLLAAGALALYFRTLCPTIYTADCGEIATAVATGGVMHPPGYPLYSLLGSLFVHLIPVGEPAWRLGILSCLSAAGAVAMTYLLGRRLGAERIWATLGAIIFALSYELWQQATKVETYALNTFFVGLILVLAISYSQSRRRFYFFSLAFVLGLALTNHLTTLLLLPALLLLILPALWRSEDRAGFVKMIFAGAGIAIAPLFLYGYEIYAASTHQSGQVWGDPSNLYRLYLQVTGSHYHGFFHSISLRGFVNRDFVFLPLFMGRNVGLWLVFSLIGLIGLLRTDRRVACALILAVTSYVGVNTFYWIYNIYEYYTPVVLVLCVLAGLGAHRTAGWISARRPGSQPILRVLGPAVLAVACVFAFRASAPLCDRSHATWVRTFAQNVLLPLPPHAVLITQGDTLDFSLWYAQDVLHERQDVLVVCSDFLGSFGPEKENQTDTWYLQKLARGNPAIDPGALVARCASDRAYATHLGPMWDIVQTEWAKGRPLYALGFSTDDAGGALAALPEGAHTGPALPTLCLVPEGLSDRLVPLGRLPSARERLAANLADERLIHPETASLNSIAPETEVRLPDEILIRRLTARFFANEGTLLCDAQNYSGAYSRLQEACALDPWSAHAQNAYGVACIMTGKKDEAIASFREACTLDPGNAVYQANLQRALGQATQARS